MRRLSGSYREALSRHSPEGSDPRDFFGWRLPAAGGADVLSAAEIETLRGLPEGALVDLLGRVSTAVRELVSLERQLSSRWVVERVCPVCGEGVFGRSDKVYCSAACRQSAYAERASSRGGVL